MSRPLPFPEMDDLIHHVSKGIHSPSRKTSHERLHPPTPPNTPRSSMTAPSTRPDTSQYYIVKLKAARTAFVADDFLTATKLSYQILEDHSIPYFARAQAALIITAYDAYPGDKQAYVEAVGIVESVKGMDQEQVEPNYKTLQLQVDGKKLGEVSSAETAPALRMEQSQIRGDIAARGLSGVEERDVGMALRKRDREQLDGPAVGSEESERKEGDGGKRSENKSSQEEDGPVEGQAERKTKANRECSCTVI